MIFRAVAYSPLGGAFGLAAWGICSILDAPKPASESSGGAFELITAMVGVAVRNGSPARRFTRPGTPAAPLPLPVAKRGASIGLNVARVLLVLICLVGVVYLVVPDIPSEIQSARWQRAYKKHLSEKPSLESATSVQSRPVDQILIVRPFGEYLPGTAKVTLGNPFPDSDTRKASQLRPQWYTIRYQLRDESVSSPESYVDVAVVEFPSPAWAKYEVGTWSTGLQAEDIYAAGGMAHTRIFSGKRQPNGSGLERYVWTSGAFVIEVRSNLADARCAEGYLEKYPSTL